ncbi:hypothetical protein [Egbenema bharatensis]|uniref:hypothetical protein n=1 Tax=Egbenema bharatensis TaxID=3463334 RepID=UPI003A847C05
MLPFSLSCNGGATDEDFSEQTGIFEDYISNRLPKVSSEQIARALSEIQHWQRRS